MWHTRKFTFSLQPYYSRVENVKFYSTSQDADILGKQSSVWWSRTLLLTLGCLDWRILSIFNFCYFFSKNEKKWVHSSGILPSEKSIENFFLKNLFSVIICSIRKCLQIEIWTHELSSKFGTFTLKVPICRILENSLFPCNRITLEWGM